MALSSALLRSVSHSSHSTTQADAPVMGSRGPMATEDPPTAKTRVHQAGSGLRAHRLNAAERQRHPSGEQIGQSEMIVYALGRPHPTATHSNRRHRLCIQYPCRHVQRMDALLDDEIAGQWQHLYVPLPAHPLPSETPFKGCRVSPPGVWPCRLAIGPARRLRQSGESG
jgi:hypothetical protein